MQSASTLIPARCLILLSLLLIANGPMLAAESVPATTEMRERGLISPKDLGGLNLRFGDHRAMVDMISRIGNREGLGDLLAEGSRRAAERIGQGSERFAMHVKGLELPG